MLQNMTFCQVCVTIYRIETLNVSFVCVCCDTVIVLQRERRRRKKLAENVREENAMPLSMAITIKSHHPILPTIDPRLFSWVFDEKFSPRYYAWRDGRATYQLRVIGGPGSGKVSLPYMCLYAYIKCPAFLPPWVSKLSPTEGFFFLLQNDE